MQSTGGSSRQTGNTPALASVIQPVVLGSRLCFRVTSKLSQRPSPSPAPLDSSTSGSLEAPPGALHSRRVGSVWSTIKLESGKEEWGKSVRPEVGEGARAQLNLGMTDVPKCRLGSLHLIQKAMGRPRRVLSKS